MTVLQSTNNLNFLIVNNFGLKNVIIKGAGEEIEVMKRI